MGDVDSFRNSADASGKKVQSAMQSEFFALSEKQVHAQAYAECGRSATDSFDERLDQTEFLEVGHRVAKRADSGQDELCGRANLVRVGCHFDLVPEPSQCIFDTAEVVQFVVNNGDHK